MREKIEIGRKVLKSGAAQGSILGSELWSASYDGIHCMHKSGYTHLVGYAVDGAAVVTARNVGS